MGGPGTDTGFTGCSPRLKQCLGELGVKRAGVQAPRYPCFLKTIAEYTLNSWMQIPTEFVDLHGDKFFHRVDLEGPDGTVWIVNVVHTTRANVGFGPGWMSFVGDNNLKKGNQILFTLISKSRFTVHIFNKSGLETATSLGTNADPTVSFNSKRKSEQFEDEDLGRIDSENSEGGEYESFECGCQSPPDTPSQAVHVRASLRLKRAKLERAEQGPRIQDILLEYGLKGQVTSERKLSSSHDSQEKDPATELVDWRKSSKEPGYISTKVGSKRRAVTDAERKTAKIAALSFQSKSKKPSVVVLMMPSQVYRGFWLNIPKDFSQKHLPSGRCPMKLQDTAGFQWPATWIMNAQRSGVSGGWGGFSKDHRLEEGDYCVFELIDPKRYTFLVNIFRVVEIDLVPGSRGEWRKRPHNMARGLGYTYHKYPKRNQLKAKNFRLGSSSLKNTLAKTLYAEVRKGRTAECQNSRLNKLGSSVGEDDVFLKNNRRERATQGGTEPNSEEVDVKQEIAPLGFTNKKFSETFLPATIKVQEESISKSDFNPTTSAPAILKVAVKPEAVNPPSVAMEKEGKVWYPVSRLISRRQSKNTLEVEFLVELEGRVMQNHGWGPAERDVRGNRWVPYTHFSPDFASCFLS